MRDSDIFILPSKNETFGMVYLEALASGCITVCSKNDGIDGIIKDEFNGFLSENLENDINRIINFKNKQEILNNAYNTIKKYTDINVAEYYLKNLEGNYEY